MVYLILHCRTVIELQFEEDVADARVAQIKEETGYFWIAIPLVKCQKHEVIPL